MPVPATGTCPKFGAIDPDRLDSTPLPDTGRLIVPSLSSGSSVVTTTLPLSELTEVGEYVTHLEAQLRDLTTRFEAQGRDLGGQLQAQARERDERLAEQVRVAGEQLEAQRHDADARLESHTRELTARFDARERDFIARLETQERDLRAQLQAARLEAGVRLELQARELRDCFDEREREKRDYLSLRTQCFASQTTLRSLHSGVGLVLSFEHSFVSHFLHWPSFTFWTRAFHSFSSDFGTAPLTQSKPQARPLMATQSASFLQSLSTPMRSASSVWFASSRS